MDIYSFLNQHSIQYQRFDHPPVYTVEQANRIRPDLPGKATKNLFLQDKKGKRHILLTFDDRKTVDLKELAGRQGVSRLSLASPAALEKLLGLSPGAVSLLGLVNDLSQHVEVWIDQDLWQAQALLCHPLVNTTTLSIPLEGIRKFLKGTGHIYRLVEIV